MSTLPFFISMFLFHHHIGYYPWHTQFQKGLFQSRRLLQLICQLISAQHLTHFFAFYKTAYERPVQDLSPTAVFDDISKLCFQIDKSKRGSFNEIEHTIKTYLK